MNTKNALTMNTSILYILFIVVLYSTTVFSQNQSSFNKGFNDGFKETLAEVGYNSNYFNYSNPNNCYSEFSSNRNNTYSEGYRCGVKQATKALPKIKKSVKSNYAQSNNQDIRRKSIVGQQNRVVEANEGQNRYLQNQRNENHRINSETQQTQRQNNTERATYQNPSADYRKATTNYRQSINTNLVGKALRYKQQKYNQRRLVKKRNQTQGYRRVVAQQKKRQNNCNKLKSKEV